MPNTFLRRLQPEKPPHLTPYPTIIKMGVTIVFWALSWFTRAPCSSVKHLKNDFGRKHKRMNLGLLLLSCTSCSHMITHTTLICHTSLIQSCNFKKPVPTLLLQDILCLLISPPTHFQLPFITLCQLGYLSGLLCCPKSFWNCLKSFSCLDLPFCFLKFLWQMFVLFLVFLLFVLFWTSKNLSMPSPFRRSVSIVQYLFVGPEIDISVQNVFAHLVLQYIINGYLRFSRVCISFSLVNKLYLLSIISITKLNVNWFFSSLLNSREPQSHRWFSPANLFLRIDIVLFIFVRLAVFRETTLKRERSSYLEWDLFEFGHNLFPCVDCIGKIEAHFCWITSLLSKEFVTVFLHKFVEAFVDELITGP